MRPVLRLSLSAVLALALAASPATAQTRTLRLVDRQPEAADATTEAIAWPTDLDAAFAAAKQRQTLLLLFFTAKW